MPINFYSDRGDTNIPTCPGRPYPLGAYYDGHGINFALYSEYATKVYLCLFQSSHNEKQQLVEYARLNVKGKLLLVIYSPQIVFFYVAYLVKKVLYF
jgi:pullulanase/glycogen debranching enzyme